MVLEGRFEDTACDGIAPTRYGHLLQHYFKKMKLHDLWIPLTWIVSLLFGCSDSNYHKKDGKWHYDGVPMEGVNEPVKLKVIDRYFAKDERTGFYQGSRIYHGNEASDGATFEVLNSWYAKDQIPGVLLRY